MKKIAVRSYINGDEYVEVCDNCGDQSRTSHYEFKELNRINKSFGWVIKYEGGQFKGYCPNCVGRLKE